MPKFLNILVFIVLLVFIAYYFVFNTKKTAGESAPEIESQLVNGSKFELTDLKGQYVLLDFWASWCGPCIKEAPKLVALDKQFSKEKFTDADGFSIVSVALEKTDKTWRRAVERLGFSWEHQIVEIVRFVRMSKIATDYGVVEIPTKFLIGPNSEIVLANPSLSEVSEFLAARQK